MTDHGWCIVCDTKRARSNRRCKSCLNYLRTHGHDRSEDLVIAANIRRFVKATILAQ